MLSQLTAVGTSMSSVTLLEGSSGILAGFWTSQHLPFLLANFPLYSFAVITGSLGSWGPRQHHPFHAAHLQSPLGLLPLGVPTWQLLTWPVALGNSSLRCPELSPLLQLGDDFRFWKLRSWTKGKTQDMRICHREKQPAQNPALDF